MEMNKVNRLRFSETRTCTFWSKRSFRIFLIAISLACWVFWMDIAKNNPIYNANSNDIIANNDPIPSTEEKKIDNGNDFKYILIWTRLDYVPMNYFGSGSEVFEKNNCPEKKCFVTDQRGFFGNDITKFDAIAFNGRNLKLLNASDLPKVRSTHQKYIYFNMESAVNEPICTPEFNNYFNWTATYRLNSDIAYAYIVIKDLKGNEVGPLKDVKWTENLPKISGTLANRLRNKKKAVAWFVSNCQTKSQRELYVKFLEKSLRSYNLEIDIYGDCGNYKCDRFTNEKGCNELLARDYYFYLSFENSFDEDYVTEKLLTALQNDVVPIVYGGANYSRFLPPGSYLDTKELTPNELASIINWLMKNPMEYFEYFKWKYQYVYSLANAVEDVCRVCAALHNKTMFEKYSVYEDLRSWWSPNYVRDCL